MSQNFNGSKPGLYQQNSSSDSLKSTLSHESDAAADTPKSPIEQASSGSLPVEQSRDEQTSGSPVLPEQVKEKNVATLSGYPPTDPEKFASDVNHNGLSAHEITYPEGGLEAWLVVFGAFAGMLASFGLMNTIGVYQSYLATNQLEGYSESSIGWISTLR